MDLFGGYELTAFQNELLTDPHTLIVAAGNRGSHKSSTSLMRIMDLCESHPGVEGFIGRMVRKDLYKTVVSEWKKLYPPQLWESVYAFDPPNAIEPEYIRFKNGSLIHLLPLTDIERLRGANLGFFFIDQLEECGQQVLADAIKVLRGPFYDRNGNDVGNAKRVGLATVNKAKTWFWIKRLFVKGVGFDKKPLPESVKSQMRLIEPPVEENEQFWREGYYDRIKAMARSQAEIDFEVYGKDPEEWGLVFPDFTRGVHTQKFEYAEDRFKDASFMLSYDDGYDVPAAFSFIAVTPDGKMWIRHELYEAKMTLSVMKARLHEIANKIGFPLRPHYCRFVCDRAILGHRSRETGMSIAEQWGNEWPWRPVSKNRTEGWMLMRSMMEVGDDGQPNLIFHEEDCPNTVAEVEEAYYDEDKPGKLLNRCEDHGIDNVRYACVAAKTPFESKPPPDLTGTWKQFREASESNASWAMPSEDRAPVMVPRKPLASR